MGKISELPLAGPLTGAEQTLVIQEGEARRAPFSPPVDVEQLLSTAMPLLDQVAEPVGDELVLLYRAGQLYSISLFDLVQYALSDPADPGLPPVITGTPPSTGSWGAAYSFTPSVVGGTPPYSFGLTGDLPPGLSFDTATGTISGTPL